MSSIGDGARRRHLEAVPKGALDSWKEIASYLGRTVRTVQRWERHEGLPVHRLNHRKRGTVVAYREELDLWIAARISSGLLDGGHSAALPDTKPWLKLVALVLLTVLSLVIWWVVSAVRPEEPVRITPLTSYKGVEWSPAFSPDGRSIAFAWDPEIRRKLDIYVKQIGEEPPRRLTFRPTAEAWPAWSPDGKWVAYVTEDPPGGCCIGVVNSAGGPDRDLVRIPDIGRHLPAPYIAWTPDGSKLIVPNRQRQEGSFALFLVDFSSGAQSPLTSPPPGILGDSGPVLSPDGRSLAFVRSRDPSLSSIQVMPFGKGAEKPGRENPLVSARSNISNLMWMADGQEIVYLTSNPRRLWRVRADGHSQPREVSTIGNVGIHWTMAPGSKRMAYVELLNDADIWRIHPGGRNAPERLISSSQLDRNPQYSPDGRRIAFLSSRSGNSEIWLADADGTNQRQLTSLNGPDPGAPRWSPDGQFVVFESRSAGNGDIWRLRADSGDGKFGPDQLTSGPANDFAPSYSSDGQWIYFSSDRGGDLQIWKMPAWGGTPAQITRKGGYAALESPDGRFVYYAKGYGVTSLWRVPAAGGDEVKIIASLSGPANFAVTRDGIYYARWVEMRKTLAIELFRFASQTMKNLAVLDQWIEDLGLSASPDGTAILFGAEHRTGADIMMVENFR